MESSQGETFVCPSCGEAVDEEYGVLVGADDGDGEITICAACVVIWPPEPRYIYYWL